MTYGTTINFSEKPKTTRFIPSKPMKIGDPAHVGHNKTFGGGDKSTEYKYYEEHETDTVKY